MFQNASLNSLAKKNRLFGYLYLVVSHLLGCIVSTFAAHLSFTCPLKITLIENKLCAILSSRPGRPPKRGVPFPPMSPQDAMLHLKNSMHVNGSSAGSVSGGAGSTGTSGTLGASPGSGGSSGASSDLYKDAPYPPKGNLIYSFSTCNVTSKDIVSFIGLEDFDFFAGQFSKEKPLWSSKSISKEENNPTSSPFLIAF